VLFVVLVVLAVDTGTAVTFLFTCDMDLFFAVAVLAARRKVNRGLRGRVVILPSGFLVRKVDLNLLMGLSGCLYLSCLFVLVRRREDAEGNGYSGFKIQIADLMGARVLSSTTFRAMLRKEDKKISLALLSIC
jgi:hypothetical protein